MVDGRVGSNLSVVGNVSMREFAANDVGVFRECCEGRGEDFYIIRYSRVMVSSFRLAKTTESVKESKAKGKEDIHHDRQNALVRNSCKPANDPLLTTRTGKISWHENKSPLCPSILCTLQLLYNFNDTV